MRNQLKKTLTLFSLVLIFLTGFVPAQANQPASWKAKVDPWLLDQASRAAALDSGPIEFLALLSEQADLSGADALKTKLEKGSYVFQKLIETARRTQTGIIQQLKIQGAAYRSFWVVNMVWVKGDFNLIQALAQRPDVAHIYANPQVKLQLPQQSATNLPQTSQTVQWNLSWVNADKVWAAGYTGQGVVVGGADTGYNWQHVALLPHYRGWNGVTADHNYNWHDAIHDSSVTGDCPHDSPVPCDVYGHGTHTMGTMVGDDGAGTRIGMAPGAKWIGCRNMDNNGNGSPARYTECFEWFIAPYALGADPSSGDPSKAPDVINNSWACTISEGCTDPNELKAVVDNVRAAGILVVASAGNSGFGSCSTVSQPPAIYASSFTVGATGSYTDQLASFSSLGPVTVDSSNRLKPDVVAPGESIYSSYVPGNAYRSWMGTSMAAPHVAGLAALLISADPALAGQVDSLESIIEQNTKPITTTLSCGGTSGVVPNNVYGWGRIDSWAAYQALPHHINVEVTAAMLFALPGSNLTYTLTVTNQDPVTITQNAVVTDVISPGASVISATQPFSLTNQSVIWKFPSLGMSESKVVSLTLQAPQTAPVKLVNQAFVSSQEVGLKASNPVTVTVGFWYVFPLVAKSP